MKIINKNKGLIKLILASSFFMNFIIPNSDNSMITKSLENKIDKYPLIYFEDQLSRKDSLKFLFKYFEIQKEKIINNNYLPLEKDYIPRVYISKETKEKVIAITIDDLYISKLVRKSLEIAKKYNIKFTFFPAGIAVEQDPELYKEIVAQGHELELHGYEHYSVTDKKYQKTVEKIQENYLKEMDVIHDLVDESLIFHFIRPAFGSGYIGYSKTKEGIYPPLSEAVSNLKRYNLDNSIDLVIWSKDFMFKDGRYTTQEEVLEFFKKNLGPGEIFLYHTRKEDISVLDKIVEYALSKGYKIVTLTELLKE